MDDETGRKFASVRRVGLSDIQVQIDRLKQEGHSNEDIIASLGLTPSQFGYHLHLIRSTPPHQRVPDDEALVRSGNEH